MDIKTLAAIQREFDKTHGWLPTPGDAPSILDFLRSDVVGLCGEVGEVAGIVKTLGLESTQGDVQVELKKRMPDLHEELIDVLIYLVRIIDYLEVDVESVYMDKLKKNEVRFAKYEQK
tara:strand:- start:12634 stop:12987 length:354 start_codon:yes stop_codon:yes gene_type:complete